MDKEECTLVRKPHSGVSVAKRREAIAGYLFISRGFSAFCCSPSAHAGPLGSAFSPGTCCPRRICRAKNYEKLMTDRHFATVLRVTFTYTFASVPLGIVVGFGIALS
jgi:ABC-type sugar transport system permease subunit